VLGVEIDQKSLDNFVKDLKKLGHIIGSSNMQLYRAKKYRDFTVDMVKKGQLDLEPLSEATKMLVGDHIPLNNTGTMIDYMGIRPHGKNEADAGYFGANKSGKPNIAQLAILMHTGYKIPLQGPKGEKVRKWLLAQNIFVRHDKEYLIVPARPFLFQSYMSYMMTGQDLIACDEFIQKLMDSPIDDAGASFMKGKIQDMGEPGGEE
jgi:hypothetical protein